MSDQFLNSIRWQ